MILFNFQGTGQPFLSIVVNHQTMFDGIIDGEVNVELPVSLDSDTIVQVKGIGKRNGEDGIWDTKLDDQGNIIADKYLTINNICISGISMGNPWIQSINSIENYTSTSIYNNGEFSFKINSPVLDWIIEEKFIKPQSVNNSLDFYNDSGKFDYTLIQEKINNIKRLLND